MTGVQVLVGQGDLKGLFIHETAVSGDSSRPGRVGHPHQIVCFIIKLARCSDNSCGFLTRGKHTLHLQRTPSNIWVAHGQVDQRIGQQCLHAEPCRPTPGSTGSPTFSVSTKDRTVYDISMENTRLESLTRALGTQSSSTIRHPPLAFTSQGTRPDASHESTHDGQEWISQVRLWSAYGPINV